MPSLLVHIFLISFLLFASYYACKERKYIVKEPLIWIAITIVALIVGLQDDPNVDWANYKDTVSTAVLGDFDVERLELIPKYLAVILHQLNLPYYLWFVIMMWLIYLFIVLAANNGLKIIFPWIFFFFFYTLFSLSMIITRQVVALAVILYAYTFIGQRKLKLYLILIGVAYCFHRTSLICLPLYWLIPRLNLKSIPVQVGIVVAFLIFGQGISTLFWSYVPAADIFRYGHYAETTFDYGAKTGYGVIANYVRYFIIVFYSNKLKDKYDDYGFSIFYSLTFVHMCLYASLMNDLALSRVSMYFSVSELASSGFLLHYLLGSKNGFDKLVFWGLVLIIIIIILVPTFNAKPWTFV